MCVRMVLAVACALALLGLAASAAEKKPVEIKYGKLITLTHTETGKNLYSSPVTNNHEESSKQQQIVATAFEDSSCYWRVLPPAGTELSDVEGEVVRDADVLRLQHINTNKMLHSHTGFKAPISTRQEVTGFNGPNDMDENDNWIIRVLAQRPGEPWSTSTGVRFMHHVTGSKLISEADKIDGNKTSGQQEVAASPSEPDALHGLYEWTVKVPRAQCELGQPVDECVLKGARGSEGPSDGVTAEQFGKFLQIFETWNEQRFKSLNDDPNNTPKEISFYCPTNPNVNIQELDYTLQAEGTCMVLNIQAPHMEAKLALKCSHTRSDSGDGTSHQQEDDAKDESSEHDEM